MYEVAALFAVLINRQLCQLNRRTDTFVKLTATYWN